MGKWGKYKKKYKRTWENEPALNGWLMENINASTDPDGREARCKVCECNLRAHHSDLVKHSQTTHHKANASKICKRQPQLTNMGIDVVSQEHKKRDICMAVYIATHSAVRSIDHLCQILKDLGKGSSLENIKLHRTKCSKLIKNVIAPAMLTELVSDIGNEGFSLIVDESTEVSNKKYLAFVVRYYSKKKDKITNEFLGFVDVERATAQKLFDSTLEYLKTIGLKYENVIGIGTDGANNMCGIHNSYFTLFKEKVPTLQLVKCVCHSLHLCTSKASDELPSNLEFLLRETRNWFHDSPLRQQLYHTLYQTINVGKLPKKLVQLSKTRWLAWHKAICVIVDQWLELKTHFNAMALNRDERCVKARILSDIYNDDSNLLYFMFLKPITAEMNRANLNFQKDYVEVTKLFSDLKVLLLTFARRILKPVCLNSINEGKFLSTADFESLAQALNNDSSYLHYDSVDYGSAFENTECCDVPQETLQTIKQRCLRFLSVLCKQLVVRLPSNVNLFETLHYFNPDECLKRNQPCFSKLPHTLIPPDISRDALKTEWEKLIWINWTEHFNGTLPTDSESFWRKVKNVKNACGESAFENISRFALRTLSLPFSNAAVERVFSVMNAVKTKARNRMHTDMLVAIMRVRMGLRTTCCNNFMPSTNMYALFTSKMYTEKEENASSSSRDDYDELVETLTLYADIDDDD